MENWNLLVFTKNKCVSENGNILMKTEDAQSLLNTIAIETCVQIGYRDDGILWKKEKDDYNTDGKLTVYFEEYHLNEEWGRKASFFQRY